MSRLTELGCESITQLLPEVLIFLPLHTFRSGLLEFQASLVDSFTELPISFQVCRKSRVDVMCLLRQ